MKPEQVAEATELALENEDAAALAAIKRRLQKEVRLVAMWLGATSPGPIYLETARTWFVHLHFPLTPEPVYLQVTGSFWQALVAKAKAEKEKREEYAQANRDKPPRRAGKAG